MKKNIHIRIGSPEEMGDRFVSAWHKAEAGEQVEESNLTFRDLESLLTALTPKRLILLRYVRHHRVRSIRSLAEALERDYKNVHNDVDMLAKLGLLARTPDRVLAPYGEVEARLVL
jgi:predicted transcriptional regulator